MGTAYREKGELVGAEVLFYVLLIIIFPIVWFKGRRENYTEFLCLPSYCTHCPARLAKLLSDNDCHCPPRFSSHFHFPVLDQLELSPLQAHFSDHGFLAKREEYQALSTVQESIHTMFLRLGTFAYQVLG